MDTKKRPAHTLRGRLITYWYFEVFFEPIIVNQNCILYSLVTPWNGRDTFNLPYRIFVLWQLYFFFYHFYKEWPLLQESDVRQYS